MRRQLARLGVASPAHACRYVGAGDRSRLERTVVTSSADGARLAVAVQRQGARLRHRIRHVAAGGDVGLGREPSRAQSGWAHARHRLRRQHGPSVRRRHAAALAGPRRSEAARPARRGHQGVVVLAFDATGARLAAGGEDHVLRIWNVATRQVERLLLHDATVQAVAFRRDGAAIATGTLDNQICVWNLRTGARELTLVGNDSTGAGQEIIARSRRRAGARLPRRRRVVDRRCRADNSIRVGLRRPTPSGSGSAAIRPR
ncbi:MAG: hypothetical protein U1E76_26850 [Planctomycetota bacterium]